MGFILCVIKFIVDSIGSTRPYVGYDGSSPPIIALAKKDL